MTLPLARSPCRLPKVDSQDSPVPQQPDELLVSQHRLGDIRVVVAKREIDFMTAPALVAELERAIREGEGKVVVDLCDVSFMDSSGAHALLEASKRLRAMDRGFSVICVRGSISRLLEILGLGDRFALHTD
jgi:anti-anti-sigma factor